MKIGSRVVIDEVDGLPTTRSGSGVIISAKDTCCDETCLGREITVRVDKNNPMIDVLGYNHFDITLCITSVRLDESVVVSSEFTPESAIGEYMRTVPSNTIDLSKASPMDHVLNHPTYKALMKPSGGGVEYVHEPRELLPHECFYCGVEEWVDETAECSGNKATCSRHGKKK